MSEMSDQTAVARIRRLATEEKRRWRLKYPDKYLANLQRNKERYRANLEDSRAKAREYNKGRDPEKVRAANRKQRQKNPEYVRERDRLHRLRTAARDWAKRSLRLARSRSKRKGFELLITEADLEGMWDRQSGRCYWTGIAMVRTQLNILTGSMDRLDNSVGYIVGNVVLCTWGANRARGDSTIEDFENFLSLIRSGPDG